ncbi:hypothetical protein COB21_00480 [Candidatus Aerophobetes bacterium]|uniref:Protease 3 n=1 Tax=Aerophobetes bacterium TaxID=2030807 RepID=A0A2A4X977_UNCAE|nr:MAG: hypothetical protein COB21_00480 [Candidatus Aerophobetes bacterium]
MRLLKLLCIALPLSLSLFSARAHSYEIIENNPNFISKNPRLQNQKVQKLRLDNGISVYLLSDPETPSSGAAFSMRVGSWDDPEEYPGIAHFVEHLLFMGSHTYPDENLYRDAVSKAGGALNAYTASKRTVYGFYSDNTHFEEIFPMFAHMLMDPLFNPGSIAREYKAIEQEYQISLSSDPWRTIHVLKALANPQHPQAQFDCGNSQTLANIPVETAINWYKEHYKPHLGALVITSPLPLETMVNMAQSLFGQIPAAKDLSQTADFDPVETPLFLPETFPSQVHITPHLQESQSMAMLWELPPSFNCLTNEGQNSAHVMLTNSINTAHKGSLYETLKEADLITDLSSYIQSLSNEKHLFFINFQLTDKGVANLDQVEMHTDAYLKQMAKTPIPAYFTQEIVDIWKQSIETAPRQNPFSFCMNVAGALTSEDISSYPQSSSGLSNFDPQQYLDLVNFTQVERAIQIYLINPEKTDTKMTELEPWYKVPYTVVHQESKEKSTPENIHFTLFNDPNPYLPNNTEPITSNTEAQEKSKPKQLIKTKRGELTYWKDDVFMLPKVALHALIQSPCMDLSAHSDVCLDLFAMLTAEQLAPINTKGKTADIGISVTSGSDGILIALSGYQDKSLLFFSDALDSLAQFNPTKTSFEAMKQLLKSNQLNSKFSPAYTQVMHHMSEITSSSCSTKAQYLEAIESLTKEQYVSFIQNVFNANVVKMVVSGALNEQEAENFYTCFTEHPTFKNTVDKTDKELKMHTKYSLALDGTILPQKVHISFDQKDTAVALMIQDEEFSFAKHASNFILNYSLSNEFFDTLRTKQQTGYAVFSYPSKTNNDLISHNFCVQSTTHSGEELLARYELFLEDYVASLEETFTPEVFEEFKATLKTQINTPEETLAHKNGVIFHIVCNNDGDFTRKEKLLKATDELSHEEFTSWAKQLLGRNNRKRLAVVLQGNCDEGSFAYVKKERDTISFQTTTPKKTETLCQ